MATKEKRWVKVKVKGKSGGLITKWKDTKTGKTYFSKPLLDPDKKATGRFGLNKLTSDEKINEKLKIANKKGWKESRAYNKKKGNEGQTGGVLGGSIPKVKKVKEKRTHNPDKKLSNIPAKEGKQNNPDFGKKVYHQTPTPQKPSPTWGVNKTKSSSSSNDSDRAAWLKKTRNSPAAKAGLSDDQRWEAQLRHREWKKKRKKKK